MSEREPAPGAADAADVLERTITIEAPPDIVFRYFIEPERMTAWMGREATLDAQAGGAFRIVYNDHDVAGGSFLEVDPPRRVVFTWGWEATDAVVRPGGSRVEVDLEAIGSGTRLRLRHLGLPAPEIPTHGEGWDYFLGRLVAALAAG
jgi:uncharacterized protein YndB with AHSA1/START domain